MAKSAGYTVVRRITGLSRLVRAVGEGLVRGSVAQFSSSPLRAKVCPIVKLTKRHMKLTQASLLVRGVQFFVKLMMDQENAL